MDNIYQALNISCR